MVWKVGVIGAGHWSEKHLQAWNRIDNVEIGALVDLDASRLSRRAGTYQIDSGKLYTSIDDMLSSTDVDIVDIVTGPETHLELVEKAAVAGKHIMCQKPFAESLQLAEEIVRVAEREQVRLMVTENWRWLQTFQLVKKTLEDGTLGDIQVARYYHTDFYTPRMTSGTTLPQPFLKTMPKLLFYEMGCHWFDTWRFLFGTPERLYAEYRKVSPHVMGEDTGLVVFSHKEFYGYLDMSWATRRDMDNMSDTVGPQHRESLVIEGAKATLKLYATGRISIIRDDGLETTLLTPEVLDHEESHYRLQCHFIDCLETGEEFQTSGADNLVTLCMVFEAYRSAREHIAIEL